MWAGDFQLSCPAGMPFLLNNSDTWTCLDDKTIKELDKLQVLFLSVLLSVPTSTPRPAIFFDTGSITMELEIMKRKLNLIQHIKNLDDNCLAKEIYNEQIRNNWPGLTKECEEFCEFLKIPNVITTEMTKGAWKNKVKQAIREKNSQNLKDKMEKYSKLEEMRLEEKCELKSYFSDMTMEEARTHFRIRSKMISCKFKQQK